MSVRPGRGQSRPTASRQITYHTHTFPGPSEGWISNQNLAGSTPGGAYQLDNIFPTPTGGRLRRGCAKYADVSGAVRSLWSYGGGSFPRLFAATDSAIWDITVGHSPNEMRAVTEGRISVAQYATTNDDLYVRGVNGADDPWLFDGTDFVTTPALTLPSGEGGSVKDMAFTWVFKNRFFFIRKNSLDAFYLPVGQLGGELTKFSLGGVFRLGGSLMFGGTWSQETGSGLASMCVFATTEGEVAVYQGSNPNDANDWQRVGVYSIGKLLGPGSIIHRGGDLAICTDVGLISLSQALARDTEAISPTAMSRPIEQDWSKAVSTYHNRNWSAATWTAEQMLVAAPPTVTGASPVWFVSHASTGRWARFTGWDATCLGVFNDRLYFGSPDGGIYQANVGGSDNGQPYVGVYVPLFDVMGGIGRKTVHMARAVVRSRYGIRDKLSAHTDYIVKLPPAPDAPSEPGGDVWGTAIWGTARWGGGMDDAQVDDRWRNLFGEGGAISVGVQITSTNISPIDAEIIRIDVLFTGGEVQS